MCILYSVHAHDDLYGKWLSEHMADALSLTYYTALHEYRTFSYM